MLTRLEVKGFVTRAHTERGFVFAPAVPETAAKRSALQQVVRTFFNGSAAGAASALLDMTEDLDEEELDDLERLIAQARKAKSK
jgi:predicted transcriptional regulator